MTDQEYLKQIHSMMSQLTDSNLELHHGVGTLAREVSEIRIDVSNLKVARRQASKAVREVRKKTDSVADILETSGRYELEELRDARKWTARTVVTALLGTALSGAVGLIIYLLTKGH